MPIGGDLGSLRVRITADAKQLASGLKTAKASMKSWSASSLKIVKENKESITQLGMAFTAFGAAATMASVASMKQFSTFQHQMAEVSTLLRGNFKAITDTLSAGVLDLSTQIPHSTSILTRALYDLLSAGIDAADAMETLKLSGMAATAGVTDVQTASNLATATINALGLETADMESVFDTAFATVRVGVTTFGELAASLGDVIAPASKLNIAVPELYGSIAFLTKMGLSAQRATTALGRAFESLLEHQTELAGFGVNVFGKEGEFVGVLNVMRQISGVIDGLSEKERTDVLEAMGLTEIRAQRAIVPIITNMGLFSDILGQVEQSTGDMRIAYEKMASTFKNQTQIMLNTMKVLGIEMGNALLPIFTKLVQHATDLAARFRELEPAMKGLIGKGLLIAGGLSAMAGASLLVIARLPDMIRGFAALGGIMKALPVSLAAASAALIALTASLWAGYRIYKAWKGPLEENKAELRALNETMKAEERVLGEVFNALEAYRSRGLDPTTASIGDLGLNTKELSKALGVNITETRNAEQLYAILWKRLRSGREESKALTSKLAGAGGLADAEKLIESITKDVKNAMDEARRSTAGLKKEAGTGWEEAAEKFKQWTAVTGQGYKASTLQAIAYYENLRQQTDLTEEDQRAFNNTIADLRGEWFDDASRIADLGVQKIKETREKREAIATEGARREISVISAEWEGKIEIENMAGSKMIALGQQAAQERQTILEAQNQAEADLADRMAAVRDQNLARDTERQIAAIEKGGEIRKQEQEEMSATQEWINNWLEQNAENLKKEKAYERQIAEMHWTEVALITNSGIGNLADSYIGFYELLHNLDMTDEQIKGKAIVRLAKWVDKQAALLRNLMQLWTNASTIIAKLAQLLGGGGGTAGAVVQAAQAAQAAGGVGTVAGGVAGGAGLLGKIGGGIKAGAGKVAGLPWGQIGGTALSWAPTVGAGLFYGGWAKMVGSGIWESLTGIKSRAPDIEPVWSTEEKRFAQVVNLAVQRGWPHGELQQAIKQSGGDLNKLLGILSRLSTTLGAVPTYQYGGEVQRTGPAYLHAGERVIPASSNATMEGLLQRMVVLQQQLLSQQREQGTPVSIQAGSIIASEADLDSLMESLMGRAKARGYV